MKHREAGQGLVEYAIILALVAIVVVAVLRLFGPIVGNTFCTVGGPLDVSGSSGTSVPATDPVCMPPHSSRVIDYFDSDQNAEFNKTTLDITRPPSMGTAVVERNAAGEATGKVTYTSAADHDSFEIQLCLNPLDSRSCRRAEQQIRVQGTASSVAVELGPEGTASADSATAVDTSHLDVAAGRDGQSDEWQAIYDRTWLYRGLRVQQIYGMLEAGLAAREAFDGMTLIIGEYAASAGNTVLQDGVSALILAVDSGDEDGVVAAVTAMAADLAQAPDGVQTAVMVEAGPHIVDIYHSLYGTLVPEAAFAAAVELWNAQEASEPGSTFGIIQRLEETWTGVALRNEVIAQLQPALEQETFVVIAALAGSGDEDDVALAHQLRDEFYWGTLQEAIDKAVVTNRGIRTSMQAKLEAARRAYANGNLAQSDRALSHLLKFVDVQDGKHIDPDSAALIRITVADLAAGLEIPPAQ